MMLFEMSLTGALMIVLIVLIRALLLNNLPKRVFLLLWMLVLVRLFVPFPILIGPSINAPMEIEPVRRALSMVNLPLMASSRIAEQSVVSTYSGFSWVALVYWQGALLVGGYLVSAYIMLRRTLASSRVMLKGFAVDFVAEQRLCRKVLICVSDKIKSPLTYGLLRPRILLPEAIAEDEEQLRCVLIHELTHIRQFDAPIKLLMGIALCVHWFNPFVWLMYILFNRDIEIACDERVVQRMGTAVKADYAALLLSMKRPNTPMSALSNGFSQHVLSERVVAIMEYREAGVESAVTALVLMLGLGVVLVSGLKLLPREAARALPFVETVVTQGQSVVLTAENCAPIGRTVPQSQVFNYRGEYWSNGRGSVQPVLSLMSRGYEELSVARFNAQVERALGEDPPLYIDWRREDLPDAEDNSALRFILTDYRFAAEDILSRKTGQPYKRQSFETPCKDRTLCYDLVYVTRDPENITVGERTSKFLEFERLVNEFAKTINLNAERLYAHGDEIATMLSTPAYEIRMTDIGMLESAD